MNSRASSAIVEIMRYIIADKSFSRMILLRITVAEKEDLAGIGTCE